MSDANQRPWTAREGPGPSSAPAALRNRDAILAVLRDWLPGPARVLEVGCGTGEHAAFFAKAMPQVAWHATDRDDALFASVAHWAAVEGVTSPVAPRVLDVTRSDSRPETERDAGIEPDDRDLDWGLGTFDAIFSANMIHIAPWPVVLALLDGAKRHLKTGGALIFYGPFAIEGVHTAPSNEAFDRSLRSRDPRWGVRDQRELEEAAALRGLALEAERDMPANNRMLLYRGA